MRQFNLKEVLKENQTVLVLAKNTEYNELIPNILKRLVSGSIVYVTSNKTSKSLKELAMKHKISDERIAFIDAISATFKRPDRKEKSVYFCSSPGALTEIAIVVTKFLKHNFDYIIFDSVNNFQVYQNQKAVSKFIGSMVNLIKGTETKAVFLAIQSKEQEVLVKEVSMVVDAMIDLTTD